MKRRTFLKGLLAGATYTVFPFRLEKPPDPDRSLVVGLYSGGREVSGAGYARAPVDLTGGWNSSDITFPQAQGNWGTITQAILFDESDGKILAFAPLTQPRWVGARDTVEFPPGAFRVELA